MIQPWIALVLLCFLGWSIWQESQGYRGWFQSWIPKDHQNLKVEWPREAPSNIVHVYMNTTHHWWIRSAFAIIGLTFLCVLCVVMGWMLPAFILLPPIGAIGLFGHKEASTPVVSTADDGIVLVATAETSWHSIRTFLSHHQEVLAESGQLVVHNPSSIPLRLPNGFSGWTVVQQT
jgi:hypothetical protein